MADGFYANDVGAMLVNAEGRFLFGPPAACCCDNPPPTCTPCGMGLIPSQQLVEHFNGTAAIANFRHFDPFGSHVLDWKLDDMPGRISSPIQPNYPFGVMGPVRCYWSLADGDWVLDYWTLGTGSAFLVESQLNVWSARTWYQPFDADDCMGPVIVSNGGTAKTVTGVP